MLGSLIMIGLRQFCSVITRTRQGHCFVFWNNTVPLLALGWLPSWPGFVFNPWLSKNLTCLMLVYFISPLYSPQHLFNWLHTQVGGKTTYWPCSGRNIRHMVTTYTWWCVSTCKKNILGTVSLVNIIVLLYFLARNCSRLVENTIVVCQTHFVFTNGKSHSCNFHATKLDI